MRRILGVTLVVMATLACIHVVVNVYFPESAAKGALATLEDELLKGSPATTPKPGEAPPVVPAPEQPQPKPQSFLNRIAPVQTAYAAGPITEDEMYSRIKNMPDVVEAYQRIGARMSRVDALRASGAVGEGKDGMLVVRGTLSDRRDQRTIDDENQDRVVVIKGLARAAVLAQGLQPTEPNIAQVLQDAKSTFAALRRERAAAGWWIQMPDGSWKQK
ncbi:MAG: DUF1318 domain-containing protein [Acidobacteria bacterium]|nr:DUF1318 domain-containing protein [Acidobacteriota bacterium]